MTSWRSKTFTHRQLRVMNNREGDVVSPEIDRPQTRGDCEDGPRPCPWVGCRYNLYLDVRPSGAIKLNYPTLQPDEVSPEMSCALDRADDGPATLEEVGSTLQITRERARQIIDNALRKLLKLSGRRAGAAYRDLGD